MPKKRPSYTPENKVAILRRHLLDRVPVSGLCEEYGLHPNTFYLWQKQFFENGAAAFHSDAVREDTTDKERIAALEAKLARKHEVLSELMEEHLRTKKRLGSPERRMGCPRHQRRRRRFRPGVVSEGGDPGHPLRDLAGPA